MDSVGTTALHQVETGLQAYDVEVRGDMPTLLFHRLYLRVLIRDDDQLFPGCKQAPRRGDAHAAGSGTTF